MTSFSRAQKRKTTPRNCWLRKNLFVRQVKSHRQENVLVTCQSILVSFSRQNVVCSLCHVHISTAWMGCVTEMWGALITWPLFAMPMSISWIYSQVRKCNLEQLAWDLASPHDSYGTGLGFRVVGATYWQNFRCSYTKYTIPYIIKFTPSNFDS